MFVPAMVPAETNRSAFVRYIFCWKRNVLSAYSQRTSRLRSPVLASSMIRLASVAFCVIAPVSRNSRAGHFECHAHHALGLGIEIIVAVQGLIGIARTYCQMDPDCV